MSWQKVPFNATKFAFDRIIAVILNFKAIQIQSTLSEELKDERGKCTIVAVMNFTPLTYEHTCFD